MYYNDRPDVIEANDLAKLLFLSTSKTSDGRTILHADFELDTSRKQYAAPEALRMHLTDGATHTLLTPETPWPAAEDVQPEGRWLQHCVFEAPGNAENEASTEAEEGETSGEESSTETAPGEEPETLGEESGAAPGEEPGAGVEASTPKKSRRTK